MTDRIEAIRERYAVIEQVLADHSRADWSDRTYACGGCRARAEEVPVPPDETPEQTRERWEKHQKVIYPGWTFADYNAHVAEHVVDALAPVAPDAEPTEWEWSPGDVILDADGIAWQRDSERIYYPWRAVGQPVQRDQDITDLVTKHGGRVLVCKARGIGVESGESHG